MSDRQHPLVALTLLRWRTMARDPGALFWGVAFPVLLALVLGSAFRSAPPGRVAVAVHPGDEVLARELSVPQLEVLRLDDAQTMRAIRSGRIAVAVSRPGGAVRLDFDPARPEAQLARELVHDALERAAGRRDLVTVEDHRVTDVGGRYIDFLLPGLVGFNLMGGGLFGIGFGIVDLRVRKLLRRMAATPMKRTHFLLSFALLRLALVAVELPLLLGCGLLVFGVPFRGSLAAFAVAIAIGAMSFSSLGMLVAARADNMPTISGLINLLWMPMSLGSGVFFSTERFPSAMRAIVSALPLTGLNDALRAIMLDGAGLGAVAGSLALVAGWGLCAFVAALALFRWR